MAVLAGLLLGCHLLAMNLAAAGPLLCVGLDHRGRHGDRDAQEALRWLSITSILALFAGALLGLGVGTLRWNDAYRDLLSQFASRLGWGFVELGFSLVLLVIYASWIRGRPQASRFSWCVRSGLAFVAATNLLYHFPPLFSMIAGVASGQWDLPGPLDSRTFLRLLGEGEVMAMACHFALASLAVAGGGLIYFGALRKEADPARQRIAVWGGRTALVASLLQIPVGIWLLMQLPATTQQRLMGEDVVAGGLLLAGLLTSFWLLHQLAAVAFGDTSRASARKATLALVVVVLLMSAMLERTRRVAVASSHSSFSPSGVAGG